MRPSFIRSALVLLVCLAVTACGGSSSSNGGSSSVGGIDQGQNQGGSGAIPIQFDEPRGSQIRPGVNIVANGSLCTSNFLYRLGDHTVYIGVAAHCFSADTNQGIDPCEAQNLPIGFDQVQIENAQFPGELVYSSWQAMKEVGESPGSAACVFNDFALVRVDPRDYANIHPAVRAIGGPLALRKGIAEVGESFSAYGRSPDHFGIEQLETRSGAITDVLGGGWFYETATTNPLNSAIPGDSGGPVLDGQGRALAVTSVLTFTAGLTLTPITNGVVNLDMALEYAMDNGFINRGVSLLTWSEFSPPGFL
ncbi:trypsin-like peptidase domain-containing protein [Spongiibacter nanhainus]|uniref:Trypsin-like peptidase domain-containing protein n=1 Tax=Spongiibacter nanhainus TaxID=2794344 RepID=A0A7T4R0J2_9GAMM|nr:trypsin-like peptidase domain-containing protein [Spongiibacter nanhainus]QQD18094.1 trypsin-like peptidase domain-containing protein [Spongiibacter nanhainus]